MTDPREREDMELKLTTRLINGFSYISLQSLQYNDYHLGIHLDNPLTEQRHASLQNLPALLML